MTTRRTQIRHAHIALAARYLEAEQVSRGQWEYTAGPGEGGGRWRVSTDDLARLGRARDRGEQDAYSLWCTECGEEVR